MSTNDASASADAVFELFLDDPLCGPRATAPDQFWGAEPFDGAVWQEFAQRLRPEREVASLLSALRGSSKILDVGGGNGLLTRAIAERFGSCTVVEPAAENLERLQASPSNLQIVAGSVDALPFPDRSFDAVLATWVLQYTSSPEQAVAELARVCKRAPGARVLLIQAAPWNQLVTLYNVCAKGLGRKVAHHGFLLARAASVLHGAGFRDISLSVVPVALAFADHTLELKLAAAARLSFDLHFGQMPRPAALQAELGATARAMFEESPQSLNDDGVLLTARLPGAVSSNMA